MKTITILSLVCTISFYANAQKMNESQVPPAVVKSFKAQYPNTAAKWEKEKDAYEAEFKNNNVETSVSIDDSGKILEVESEISKASLPKEISEAVARDYAGYKIEETAKIESGGITTYEVEVEKGKEYLELIYDKDGKLIKKISEENKKGEDDKKN